MNHLMFEHGVRYGQTVASTEVQQRNTIRVQIGQAVPPNHCPPGFSVIAHVSVEVPKENYGVGTLSRTPATDSKKAGYSELLFGA
ncbi:hypothetical protein VZT92_019727 [Zoarces viviparus]|uniref:Uncharacterized protein n=1 Tax=Zoarces viviparus TaxID=48416 RepID=A0AAW1EMI3_ZOAVI